MWRYSEIEQYLSQDRVWGLYVLYFENYFL